MTDFRSTGTPLIPASWRGRLRRVLLAGFVLLLTACVNTPAPSSTSPARPASAPAVVVPTAASTEPPPEPSLPSVSGPPPESTPQPTDILPAFSFVPPPPPPPS